LKYFNIQSPDPSGENLEAVVQILPIAFDLDFKLVVNVTDEPFLTSDNPVVLYNQFLERNNRPGGIAGLSVKGLQVILPLSPRHGIFLYDKDVYKVGTKKQKVVQVSDSLDVEQLNVLQFLNAGRCLYFDESVTEQMARRLSARAKSQRKGDKTNVNELPGMTYDDGNSKSLMVMHREDLRCKLKLSFVSMLKKARSYEFGLQAIVPRNSEYCESLEKLQNRLRAGEINLKFLYQVMISKISGKRVPGR